MRKQDQLDRLPDEIVVIIVNKLFHLKTLLRFSLVAKRYSSLASHTRSLVVEFPVVSSTSPAPASASASATATATATGLVARMCGFLKDMVSKLTLTEPELEPEPDTRTQMLSAITPRFQQIKHLRLHDNHNSALLGSGRGVFSFWLAIFGSHLEASLHLVAASVKRSIPNPNGSSNTTPPGPGLDAAAFEIWLEEFKTVLRSASEKHVIIRGLASECKMINTALFSESRSGGGGGGALLMMKHHIAELRASAHHHDHDHGHPAELRVVVYAAPTLDLPRTGCTLNGVLLFLALPGDQDVDYIMQVVSCSDYESEESDGEETDHPDDSSVKEFDVFTEATKLILDDHHNWEPMYDSLHPYQELVLPNS